MVFFVGPANLKEEIHTGHEVTADLPATLLSTHGLTKEFRGFAAVQGVDLTIRPRSDPVGAHQIHAGGQGRTTG